MSRPATPSPPPGWRLHDAEGFIGLVGPVWEHWEGDDLVLAFTPEEKHANQRGAVQGGMLMTLADRVMGHALRVHLGGQPVATIQLDTHFLATGHIGEPIEARATPMRVNKNIAFIEGWISQSECLLMRASGIWKRLRDDGTAAEFDRRFGRGGM
ncbi:PaaI family thioesterase [Salinisphaera sp.]|uniref:PaaI family thioesterase n=1 Tax=Salinisphaera sp. TaxID=1914330 RepID=UPI002D78A09A|nr:PaaI family thioesterase [Salinisphaera sp.]HET7313436.1 PaaI family thioesterase [Salinisphaera sp.]